MPWFLDTYVELPVSNGDGADGITAIDSLARRGDSPPFHVHHTEDEVLHLIDGELVVLVDGDLQRVRPGQTCLLPKGIPHTYRVVSETARWLVVTTHGDFERFVRETSRTAATQGLPPAGETPTLEQQRALADLAARHHIELVGPPLSEAMAEAA